MGPRKGCWKATAMRLHEEQLDVKDLIKNSVVMLAGPGVCPNSSECVAITAGDRYAS